MIIIIINYYYYIYIYIYVYVMVFWNRISILGDGEINLSPRRYHRLSRILQCMFSMNIVWTTYRGAKKKAIHIQTDSAFMLVVQPSAC